jgi:hypothetical protein
MPDSNPDADFDSDFRADGIDHVELAVPDPYEAAR